MNITSFTGGKKVTFTPWDEVVGCIVLGSHPHWEITIHPTVFLKVKTKLPHFSLHYLKFNISDSDTVFIVFHDILKCCAYCYKINDFVYNGLSYLALFRLQCLHSVR